MQRCHRRIYPLAVALMGGVAVWAFTQESPVKKPETAPIHVASFHEAKIIGYLGEPLGTIVRVGGVSVDGKTLRSKTYDGKTILRIDTVNGKKLKEPTDFMFPYDEESIAKPRFGKRFDYVVHEWGAFDGYVHYQDPDSEFPGNVIGIAAPGFGFRTNVVLHKSYPVAK